MKSVVALVMAGLGLLSGGCASIVNGHNQSLSVETRYRGDMVAESSCKLTNSKGAWFVKTPGTVTVHRAFGDLAVNCDHDKFDPALMSVASATKGMAFGNIIFGGVIGAGVDIGTGAAYDYPVLITVDFMTTRSAAAAAPSPIVPVVAPVR